MQIVHATDQLDTRGRKVCLAIGFFDGVHLGHQQIIRQTLGDARHHEALALVLTFDQHPNTVVAPQRVPALIYSLSQRLRVLGALGPDALLVLRFDNALSEQSGESFIRALSRSPGRLQSVCVGANFVFGHKRSGNVEVLKRLGKELGFVVHALSAVCLDGKPVSSTRIREAIQVGEFDQAGQMLGRPYSLAGEVRKGARLGHKLGFPTANLDATGLALPPDGVYAAHAQVGGRTYQSVVNIGVRPTLSEQKPQRHIEAHLLAYSNAGEELYGKELELVFVEKLREEIRFPSLEKLREQIARDIIDAKRRF